MEGGGINTVNNVIVDEIIKRVEELRDVIRQRMQSEGVNASGRTSEAIHVERYDGGVRMYVAAGEVAPLATLEVGRSGGKVPAGFADIIVQWSRDKGLQFATDGDRRRFGYLAARKIAREGTQRHAQPKEIYSDAVTELRDALPRYITPIVTEYIHNEISQWTSK